MRAAYALLPHPSSPGKSVSSIDVSLHGAPEATLELRYRVSGPQALAVLQNGVAGGRTYGLWAHTCCELFVGAAGSQAYREFNFSPLGAWAAYDFDAYRAGMRPAVLTGEPRLKLLRGEGAWTLVVQLSGEDLFPAGDADELLLGLAAVIESPEAALAYWALRHPAPKPDFHHRAAFVVELR